MILAVQNTSLAEDPGGGNSGSTVAERIALRTLGKRGAEYASEVRRLLDAALVVIDRCGTTSRPRVADIVAAAGLSNDAFYRHFASKDALVAALLEDGADRLVSYLAHQMSKEVTPEAKVRRWVEGVFSQADEEIAATTLAILWNGGGVAQEGSGRHFAAGPLADLLRDPLASLGSTASEVDAALCAHAVLGKLTDYLWQRAQPTPAQTDHVVEFCLAAVGGVRS
jgi:AcrR family transcriptional regulator